MLVIKVFSFTGHQPVTEEPSPPPGLYSPSELEDRLCSGSQIMVEDVRECNNFDI